jgi:3-mercaptopyruvate sulfurtransferase SseA
MKTIPFFAMLASILILSLIAGCATLTGQEGTSDRKIEPIVSTKWLVASMHLKDLVIIDIRSPDAYAAGHIPGSINEPFVTGFDPCTGPTSNWIIGSKDCLWLELPDANDLMGTIGNLGITADSRVVIVTTRLSTQGLQTWRFLTAATRSGQRKNGRQIRRSLR